ncbi:MAG: phage tail protein [Myxococcota bacterium]
MADNQWGPKPFVKPPPSVFPLPAFWGPAEVPDQVRGQPRVDTWVNKDYSWEPPAVQSVQAGPHESWVAPIIDQEFLSEPGEGSQGTKGNFRADNRPQKGGDHDSFVAPIIDQEFPSEAGTGSQDTAGNFSADNRPQKGGDHDSFVAPVIKQSFPSEAAEDETETKGSSIAEHREQEAGERSSFRDPVNKQFSPSEAGKGSRYDGVSDSFVAPVLKELFPSEGVWGIGDKTTEGNFVADYRENDVSGTGNFQAQSRSQKGTPANPLNPFVRLQAGGERDSWVGGKPSDPVDLEDFIQDLIVKQFFPSKPGTGELYDGQNDSYAGNLVRTQQAGAAESFVGGLVRNQGVGDASTLKLDKYAGSWNFEAEIDRIPGKLNFLTISGVNSESDPIEFKFGTDPFKRYLPGVAKFGEVEMTRIHKIGSDELWKWRQSVESGLIDIRNITLRLKHADNKTVVFSMTLHNCWPMKWDAPDMNAGGTEGAIEKITFKVSRVTKEVGAPGLMAQLAGLVGSLIR